MKRYVREIVTQNADGDLLVKIEVLESKPTDLKYIIFEDR